MAADEEGHSRAFWRRVNLSLRLIARLYGTAYSHSRSRTLSVLIFDYLGALADIGTIAAVGVLVHGLESSGPDGVVTLPPPLPSMSETMLLTFGAVLVAVAMGFAGTIGYWARYVETGLAVAVEKSLSMRLLAAIARTPQHISNLAGYSLAAPEMAQIIRNDPRMCGRMLSAILSATMPVTTLLPCLIALLVFNPTLSLMIIGLLVVASPILYRANKRAARATYAFEAEMGQAAQVYKGLQDWCLQSKADSKLLADNLANQLENGAISKALGTYHRLQILAESSSLVSRIVLAVSLCATLVFEGTHILDGQGSWVELVTFIMILRLSFNYVQRSLQSFIAVNRFALMANRYFKITYSAEEEADRHAVGNGFGTNAGGDRPLLSVEFIAKDGTSLVLKNPREETAVARLACIMMPGPINRTIIATLRGAVKPGMGSETVFDNSALAGGALPPTVASAIPEVTLRDYLNVPMEARTAEWSARAEELGFAQVAEWLKENGLDCAVSTIPVGPSQLLLVLQVFAAMDRGSECLVVNGPMIAPIKQGFEALLKKRHCFRLVVYWLPVTDKAQIHCNYLELAAAVGLSHEGMDWTNADITKNDEAFANALKDMADQKAGPSPDAANDTLLI